MCTLNFISILLHFCFPSGHKTCLFFTASTSSYVCTHPSPIILIPHNSKAIAVFKLTNSLCLAKSMVSMLLSYCLMYHHLTHLTPSLFISKIPFHYSVTFPAVSLTAPSQTPFLIPLMPDLYMLEQPRAPSNAFLFCLLSLHGWPSHLLHYPKIGQRSFFPHPNIIPQKSRTYPSPYKPFHIKGNVPNFFILNNNLNQCWL